MAYQKYEDGLCQGCGWPLTYTMHKDAREHWRTPDGGLRCHGCAARDDAQDRARKQKDTRHAGLRFPVRPSVGMLHAMSDPVLTYPDAPQVGASGIDYTPWVGAGQSDSDTDPRNMSPSSRTVHDQSDRSIAPNEF